MDPLRNIFSKLLETANGDGAAAGGGDASGDAGGDGDQGGSADLQRTEVEARAREWGWAPKDQWRGNPEGWLDAPDFVRRGEQVLPILQANYRKTDAELRALRQKSAQQEAALRAATESIEVLTNLSTEASRQTAKEKRRELLRQQAQARSDGDTEAEIELGEQIADITTEIKQAEAQAADGTKKPGKGKTGAAAQPAADDGDGGGDDQDGGNDPTKDPAYQAFVQQNSWFGSDRRRTVLAVEIGKELRADPATSHLQGKAFFDKVVAEVNRTIAPPRQGSKVEGGATGGNGSSGNGANFSDPSTGKTFNDLPPEAKSAFQRQAKLVVGEGRAFKTMDEWRKYYLQSYFNS